MGKFRNLLFLVQGENRNLHVHSEENGVMDGVGMADVKDVIDGIIFHNYTVYWILIIVKRSNQPAN